MFSSETSRIIRSAPALAPVPARQPIGDSFFPNPKSRMIELVERKTKASVGDDGEVVEEEVVVEEVGPVDGISGRWVF